MESPYVVVPIMEDILSPKPRDLPKNLLEVSYSSLEHYTKVQWELLWEDYVYSLRKGIGLLKRHFQSADQDCKIEADKLIFHYTNVKLKQITGGNLHLEFPLRDFGDDKVPCLQPGSLMYISNDNFKNITTVIIDDVNEDVVMVRLKYLKRIALHTGAKFDVVENKADFKLYGQYLNCLKLMTNWKDSALTGHIMGCNSTIKPPSYITADTIYDFEVCNSQTVKRQVMNLSEWPSANDLGLDESQRKALQFALTHDLAIIQGQPGTGKTFLGVKIVETLIQNRTLWRCDGPMLLVCVTGHVLDQFLEKIKSKMGLDEKQVFRFGSQTDSENLNSLRILQNRHHQKMIKKRLNAAITVLADFQAETYKCILHEENLKKYISPKQYSSLVGRCYATQQPNAMLVWLGGALWNMTKNNTSRQGTSSSCDHLIEQITSAGWYIEDNEFKQKLISIFYAIMQEDRKASLREMKQLENVWKLDHSDRWRVYLFWLNERRMELVKEISRANSQLERYELKWMKEQAANRAKLLCDVPIIAMTVHDAAMNHEFLEVVRPSIVIMEQAADILEFQFVATLTENCKHVILIGDHIQLEPQTNCYYLAIHYNTQISFFQRMIRNGVPHAKLAKQHRMRKEIAKLLEKNYSNKLEFQPANEYEQIRGIESSVFFFLCNDKEELPSILVDQGVVDQGVVNQDVVDQSEAEFAIALCRYLLQQNYHPSKITFLAFDKGHVILMQNMITNDKSLEDVCIATIDEFQGKENDIIIVVILTSNSLPKVGCVTTESRLRVALSRARMGFYAIGNSKLEGEIAGWVPNIWPVINKKLIGNTLNIFCKNHPNVLFNVSVPNDFTQLTKGGCSQSYTFTHPKCGHVCERVCSDINEDKPCELQCEKMFPCGHTCPKFCKETCDTECNIVLETKLNACGHEVMFQCGSDLTKIKCRNKCSNVLSCQHPCMLPCHQVNKDIMCLCKMQCDKQCGRGHRCQLRCGKPCGKCPEEVHFTFPKCGHTLDGICGEILDMQCKLPCEKKFPCGHTCGRLCRERCETECRMVLSVTFPACGHAASSKCGSDISQLTCFEKCPNTMSTCQHPCILPCHMKSKVPCKCGLKCDKKCRRGHPCQKACGEPCGDCEQLIKVPRFPCGHNGYTRKCFEIPDVPKCELPCEKKLPCGHTCSKLCKDMCGIDCKHVSVEHNRGWGTFVGIPCGSDKSVFKLGNCNKILPCGHRCSICQHTIQLSYNTCKCTAKCSKQCQYGHRCRKFCSEPCGECQIPIDLIHLPCGHPFAQKCFERLTKPVCDFPCEKKLPCGRHQCNRLCKEVCTDICKEPTFKKLPGCEHTILVPCNFTKLRRIACKEKCWKRASCGHNCALTCHYHSVNRDSKCDSCDTQCCPSFISNKGLDRSGLITSLNIPPGVLNPPATRMLRQTSALRRLINPHNTYKHS